VTVKDSLTLKSVSKDVWVYVHIPPTADFSALPLSGCAPLTVTFTDASSAPSGDIIKKWEWDFTNDGTIDRTDTTAPAPFTHEYTVSGTYSVSLKVTTDKGCTNTKLRTDYIQVNPLPDCTITVPSTPVCEGSTGNAASAPAAPTGKTYSYTWSVTGQGTLKTGQGTESITWDADQGPGSANIAVTVKDTATNCEKSCSQLVTVNAIPDCTITALPSSVCSSSTNNIASVDDAGTGATYDWQITGGTITSTKPYTSQITWTAGPSGTATLTVIVTTAAGCTVPQCSKDVLILDNPIVFAGPDQNVCDNVIKVSLTGTNSGGPATYLWTTSGTGYFIPDPAVQLSEEYYPSAADKTAGSVTITLTAIGCSAQSVDAMQIYIWEIPIISIVPSAT